MKTNKTDNSIEAEVVSEETVKNKKEKPTPKKYPKDSWSVNRIFWGMLFVVIGGLMLASNFDVVEVNWLNLWRLWPLVIIAFGLSILSIRHWVWKLTSLLLIVATMFAIVWVSVVGDIYTSPVNNFTSTVKTISGNVKNAEINIAAGASSININSKTQPTIAVANLSSNIADINNNSTFKNGTQYVDLGMNPLKDSNWWAGDVKSDFSINLCRHIPLVVNLDAGASDTKIDLSRAQVTKMNIKAGASSLDIKVGSRIALSELEIDSGVSSIVIRVPKNSGVQIYLSGGLTSKHLADLKEVSEDTYESTGYIESANKVKISAEIGMSSFTIERY
jgi:uncharacterized integral membrane protein